MEVTNIVNGWFDKTINNGNNYGFLLRFSGSQETNATTFGHLKFFSKNTNTIYAPQLEVRWDDHVVVTGSATGSLTALSMSGLVDNYLYMPNLKDGYKENEKIAYQNNFDIFCNPHPLLDYKLVLLFSLVQT